MRNRIFSLSFVIAFGFSVVVTPLAQAAPVSECRISASPNQTVSLGFPIAPERLNTKAKPKILVLPFRLSDQPTYTFTESEKSDYLASALLIERYSKGLSKLEFVFNPVVDIPQTVADMVILRQNQQNQWQQDETKSTWGFIRKLIADNDNKIDFTGIDGVIMHGSSTSSQSNIAEAMMFSKNPRTQWFRTIKTAEGEILNAVLLDKRTSIATIAHEIMHLYGLTDLYGTPTGPGPLSLMASNEDILLSYEKWVLGWLPDSQVQCLVESTEIDPSKISTRITMPNNKTDQVLVINDGTKTGAIIIEIASGLGDNALAFYTLNNEARPPIGMHSPAQGSGFPGVIVSKFGGVGTQLSSSKYTLLITDNNEAELVLDLIPKNQLANAGSLISAAESNRSRIQQAARANQPVEPVQIKPKKPKKKSLICIKGKTIRKVSAVKPKCPAGFRAKK
jgi:M6 family metalloprotease-like protein